MKLPSGAMTASILDQNLLQAFCHSVPVKGPHHLLNLLDQVLGFIVRRCVTFYLSHTPHKIVQRVAVRRAGRPDLLLAVVHRRAALLEDIMAVSGNLFHPGLHYVLYHIQILVSVDPEALWEDVGWHDIALVGDNTEDHHAGGEFHHHNNWDFSGVRAKPPVVPVVHFLVLREVFLV